MEVTRFDASQFTPVQVQGFVPVQPVGRGVRAAAMADMAAESSAEWGWRRERRRRKRRRFGGFAIVGFFSFFLFSFPFLEFLIVLLRR